MAVLFFFLLKMITFAVYFYPLLHRDGTVQILQNLLVRIIYHGIVQRIQVNKRSPFAAVSHPALMTQSVRRGCVRR